MGHAYSVTAVKFVDLKTPRVQGNNNSFSSQQKTRHLIIKSPLSL